MLILLLLQLVASPLAPSAPAGAGERPFVAGEVLVYDARVSVFGRVGEATLRVSGPCRIAARAAVMLSFDVTGGAAFLRVEDHTRSWVDVATLATLKYEKRESSPLGSHEESVTIAPDEQRWQDAAGHTFQTADALPLDELSLLYYVRTLPLRDGDHALGAGHFDARRNPIELKVVGRRVTDVPAGRFTVVEVQLKVRDPRRYRGRGTITIHLTDDARRIPVRIRTALPGSSAVTLELRSANDSAIASAPACP